VQELEELRLAVENPAREQSRPVLVEDKAEDKAMVVGLPLSIPAQIRLMALPTVVPAVRATDDLAGMALRSDLFALPNLATGSSWDAGRPSH
jgi:hypothetical protein